MYGYDVAATIIQKCVRGFLVRKAFHRFEQRLNSQILCFLQQIDLISNEFFNKIVKTNYFVPTKHLETSSSINNKYAQKLAQYLFPPPPPLLLPSCAIQSPPLPPPNAPTTIKPAVIPASIALPPPPPALILAARPTPTQVRHNRSPSPSSVSSASKFAQVRDIFARAEAASTPHYQQQHVPVKHSIPQAHHAMPIEQSRSPKPTTVLNAVHEYQRQHINNHQAAYKRFGHLGGGGLNRPMNFGGNSAAKPRGIAAFITNNKPILQTKQQPLSPVAASCISPSPKQPLKPVSRVIKIKKLF